MTDERQPHEPVLRPYTPSEAEPLPPVQPSAVVVPPVARDVVTETVPVVPQAEVPTTVVPVVDPPAEPVPDDAFWSGEGVVDAPSVVELAPSSNERRASPSASDVDSFDVTGDAPERGPGSLSRGALVGIVLGVVAVVSLLTVLWQSGGDDDGGGSVLGPGLGASDDATGADDPGDADVDAPAGDDAGADPDAAPSADVARLEEELASATDQISELEETLAAVPAPALPGSAIRRVVVAADASFVSVGNGGLAVIGPFGGYAAVDPATNAVTATADVAGGATRVMRTSSAVWITNYTDGQIIRVDPIANQVVSTFPIEGPDGIAKLGPTLAVSSFDGGYVAQVDPATGEILRQVAVGGRPSDLAVNEDETVLWVAVYDTGELVRIDATTFEVTDRVTVGAGPLWLAVDGDVVWVVNNAEGTITAVDRVSFTAVANHSVGAGPTAVAIYRDSLWVSVTDAGELVQLDRGTGEVVTRTPLGSNTRGGPKGMTTGAGSLWIAMQGERSVVRVTLPEG